MALEERYPRTLYLGYLKRYQKFLECRPISTIRVPKSSKTLIRPYKSSKFNEDITNPLQKHDLIPHSSSSNFSQKTLNSDQLMELIIFKNLSVNQIINFCGIRLEKKDYLEDFIES